MSNIYKKLISKSHYVLAISMTAAVLCALSLSQAQAAAPGQVGKAPRCSASSVGARGSAFHNSNGSTSVKFKVTGQKGCKVQLSANSFYAPSMSGHPYNKQVLHARNSKVFTRGTHTMSVSLPTKKEAGKGCYYQTDLTYGIHNHTPVIAYGHGKVTGCFVKKPQPKHHKTIVTHHTVVTHQTVVTHHQVNECKPGVPVGSDDCQTKVVVTTTTPPQTPSAPMAPTKLVNTGPGEVIGLFALASLAGGLIHRFVLRRKFLV